MNNLSCAFTGHRPNRFVFGYNENDERCLEIKARMEEGIDAFMAEGVNTFYSGMALGVDQWAASIILKKKQAHKGIRLIAVLPCATQAKNWSEDQRRRYFNMLVLCDEVITLNARFTRFCMFERNRYLIDHAAYLLAVYDGGGKGGTAYTVKYGNQKRRQITIIHPDTLLVTHG